MKTMQKQGSNFTILVVLCSALFAATSHAENLAVRNCTWCHGGSANGYSPAPALAGQRPQYVEKQLANFRVHTRDNPFARQYMWGAARNLDAQSVRILATYFASLPPRAASDGVPNLVALGRTIYQEGMPDANIVACVVCHGPNAEGVREIPRLGGLDYSYLKRRLEQWNEGYHAAAGPPMISISSKLSSDQMEALASYLSFVR
jgi:cytochrome c553